MTNKDKNLENDEISRLLGSLKQVEPPADFDVRVRAGIARGKTTVRHSWFPVPARVTAAMLVVVIGGYLGFRSLSTSGPQQQAAIISAPQIADEIIAEKPAALMDRGTAPVTDARAKDTVGVTPPRHDEGTLTSAPGKRKTNGPNAGGGSTDVASGIPKIIAPTGAAPTFDLSPKEALSGMGAEMDHSGTAWKVTEVKQNSLAERSGLKAGDVIEAFNKKGLTKKSAFPNRYAGKNVRVLRDGKTIVITLQP
jgi:hypothetical protein